MGKLFNTKNRQELCRLNFKSTVLNIKMNKSRLAVCVAESKIHLFQINNMKQIHEVNVFNKSDGEAFDLCCDENNCLLAYPDASKCGAIGILDAFNLQKRTIIEAHDSPLQIVRFNADGNYLCSASLMATLIRVFAIPSGTLLYTFRRGTYPSSIYSISFNPSSTLLSITSKNNMSMHIFDLNKYKYNESKKISSSLHINQTANKMSEFLPHSIKNQLEHPRAIITINIEQQRAIIKCGWLNDYTLLCATQNGYFYRYSIDDTSKTYKLLSEHSLKNTDSLKQQETKIYKTKKDEDDANNKEKKDEEKKQADVVEIVDDENNNENQEEIVPSPPKSEQIEEVDLSEEEEQNVKVVAEEKQSSQLTVDDLFNLSDQEYENESTPK